MVNVLSGCYNIHMDKQPTNHHLVHLEAVKINNQPFVEKLKDKIAKVLEGDKNFQMSKADFKKYFGYNDFSASPVLRQGNIGDCNVIACIHALSLSPFFEIICRTSMRRMEDGTWEVSLPLLGDKKTIITISHDELSPERNIKFLRRRSGRVLPDRRLKLRHIKAHEGYQALELAYIKATHGKVDRLAADEGGTEIDVFKSVLGDSFQFLNFESSPHDSMGKITYRRTLSDLPSRQSETLDFALENFNPDVNIAAVGTKPIDLNKLFGRVIEKTTGGHKYIVGGTSMRLSTGHAYSVTNVDKVNSMIKLSISYYSH